MPLFVEHRLYALRKPDDIAIKALENRLVLLMRDTDNVNGSYGSGLG